jgi:putative heme-binding domain-containing protein
MRALARLILLAIFAAILGLTSNPTSAGPQEPQGRGQKKPAKPQSDKGSPITATKPETMKVMKGYKVELLYTVPKETEGSWVNLCVDPRGRLYTSDQYGPLYRITPPAIGGPASDTKVEKMPAKIGQAQGLLWAFDALYVVVNGNEPDPKNPKKRIDLSGLYKVTASNGSDVLDTVQLLRNFEGGGGEHGPHAVLKHPDGKRLTVVCGNQTKLTKFDTTRVPPIWGEDHLLPRMPDGQGFMKGVLGPGGAIYNTDPEGKTWELFCVGFRNEFDAAYNRAGDLFTYDADMEWDFNTPWYRPTRVCFAPSGAEFGWRNGAGKYPPFYADSLPAILDIGPGSPTGITFGYGAQFPAKYQNALFICDWSYGKIYAVHLTPDGSSYKATHEEFINGSPLPLTDIVVNPVDGAMYFTIGGRKTQSGLYRVTYVGKESTAPATGEAKPDVNRSLRPMLEEFHGKKDPKAVPTAWPFLRSPDRFLRFAARVAIEHQPVAEWQDKVFTETNSQAQITALLALIRVSARDPFHKKPTDPNPDPKLGARILKALNAIDFAKLTVDQRLEMIRVYHILFNRFGRPSYAGRDATLAKLDAVYPTGNRFIDGELCQVLIYLESPTVAAKTVKLMAEAPTQEEQIEYARALRVLDAYWTPELRKEYFSWFPKAETYKGGMSFALFVKNIKDDAVATLSAEEKTALKPILDAKPKPGPVKVAANRPFVKAYTVADLAPKLEKGLAGGRDFDRGRKLFGAINCFGCHRYDNEGGAAGPDLTQVAGRFSPKDLLESIIEPSKEISDQYAAVEINLLDGRKVVGRIVNLHGDGLSIMTDMLNPGGTITVKRGDIDGEIKTSKISMMPTGLLDTLSEEEVFDLMAYVLSRGDRSAGMFKK